MKRFSVVLWSVLAAVAITILFSSVAFATCYPGYTGHSEYPNNTPCGGINKSIGCGEDNFCWCCYASGTNAQYPDGRLNAGNCVWYAWNRRCDAGEAFPTCRNGNFWDTEAYTYGWPVCNCPKVGAIAVWEGNHVGIVTNYDGEYVWADEQVCGDCGTSYNVRRSRSWWDHYIYFRGESCQSTKFVAGNSVETTDNLKMYTNRDFGSSYIVIPSGQAGQILSDGDNGKCTPEYVYDQGSVSKAYSLWYVHFEGYGNGWCAEDWLEKAAGEPSPVITSSLRIIQSSPYYVGDTITAQFTIANKGTASITFDVLTVGGRDPDDQVADFEFKHNITLNPDNSYNYQGNLILSKVGNYHFFCAYRLSDGTWNTNIPTEGGATNTLDIYVCGTAPSAPTNVQATDGTYTDKVRITWSASSGATSYVGVIVRIYTKSTKSG